MSNKHVVRVPLGELMDYELWISGKGRTSYCAQHKTVVLQHCQSESTCQVPSGVINHGVLERGPFIGDVPITTSIHGGFSIAMFDYQMVLVMPGASMGSPKNRKDDKGSGTHLV